MSPHHTRLSWHSAAGRLRLRVADPTLPGLFRGFDVPDQITAELEKLLGREPTAPEHTTAADSDNPSGSSLSSDPATDLIRLESHLRRQAAHAQDVVARLRQAPETIRVEVAAAVRARPGVARLRERRHLAGRLADAATELAAAIDARDEALRQVRAVRAFVIAVDAPDGLLAQTRDGWLLDSIRPAFVSVYASETVFAIADPRRVPPNRDAPGEGGGGDGDRRVVVGEQFGVGWRRDGDDDPDTEEPAVIGPWQLCYLPATGEVYATRRCDYLAEEVWLLGRGFVNPAPTRRLLGQLQRRCMHQPNSLIRAAHVIDEAARRGTVGQHRGRGDSSSNGGPVIEPLGWE